MNIDNLLKLQNIKLTNTNIATNIPNNTNVNFKIPLINAIIPITVEDIRFLPLLMVQLDKFCSKTIFIYSKYFFNQELQDTTKMEYIKNLPTKLNLKKEYIFYEYDIDFSLKDEIFIKPYYNSFKRHIINKARYEGFNLVDPKASWTLLIDSDEIPDGDLFNKWIHNSANWDYYEKNNIYTLNFENYVYFWNESTQLENNENSIVLLNKEIYQNKNDKYKILFFNEYERTSFYRYIPSKYVIFNIKYDDICMFHHYSWVRSEEKMRHKMKNWGHSEDFKFVKLIYNDGSVQESRLISLNYNYAEYFGYSVFIDIMKNEKKELVENSIKNFAALKNIEKIEFNKYANNPYLVNFENWLKTKSMENNFMNYKVKNVAPKFICNGKYEY